MVSPRILAQISKVATSFLTDRCDVLEQQAAGRGATGEQLNHWVTIAADVPCRVIKAGTQTNSGQALPALQDTLQDMYRVALPVSVALAVDQRIKVGDLEFDVVRVETSLTDQITHTAIVSRRDGVNA